MAQYELSVRDYWRIIHKRKSVIIFSALTLTFFSIFFAVWKARAHINMYSSTCQIRINLSTSSEDRIMNEYGFSRGESIATEILTIVSFPVMSEVVYRMGFFSESDGVDKFPQWEQRLKEIESDPELHSKVFHYRGFVNPIWDYDSYSVVNVRVSYTDPYTAKRFADTVVNTYREYRVRQAGRRIQQTIESIEKANSETENEIRRITGSIQYYQNRTKIPVLGNVNASAELVRAQRERNEIDTRIRNTEDMINSLTRDREIDDTMLSNAFAEGEGGLFREKYRELTAANERKRAESAYISSDNPEMREIDRRIADLRAQLLSDLRRNLNFHRARRNQFDEKYGKDMNHIIAELDSLDRLTSRKIALENTVSRNVENIRQLQIKRSSEVIDEVEVLQPATINPRPITRAASIPRLATIGLLLGVTIGLVVAFIFETMDTSIGTIDDVEGYIQVPVLGLIPQIDEDELKVMTNSKIQNYIKLAKNQAMLVIHSAPKGVLAESYRALRTNIQFISFEKGIKVILFTSSSPREGKTTTIVNLALTLAQSGNRVLLIDADMRRPKIDKIFGIERERGLSETILNKCCWRDAIKNTTDIITGEYGMTDLVLTPGIENLNIITAGMLSPNPSELLNSESTDQFISEVRNEYDMVLFDCSPVLLATDSVVLARKVDGVVLVYSAGKISRGSLKRAKTQIDIVNAHVSGVVLNGIKSEQSSDFDYRYKEYYTYHNEYGGEKRKKSRGYVKKVIKDITS